MATTFLFQKYFKEFIFTKKKFGEIFLYKYKNKNNSLKKINIQAATSASATANSAANLVDVLSSKKRQHDAIDQDFITMVFVCYFSFLNFLKLTHREKMTRTPKKN